MNYIRIYILLLFVSVSMFSCQQNKQKYVFEYLDGTYDFVNLSSEIQTAYGSFIIHYPRFKNKKLKALNQQIEERIKAESRGILENATAACTGFAANDEKSNHFEVTYDIFSNKEEVLSIRFNVFADWSELYFTDLYFISFNYNPLTATHIQLTDIFKQPNGGINGQVTKIAQQAAKEQTEYYSYFRVENNSLDSYKNFNISDDSIIFNIDDYSLEYYSCYSLQLEVPLPKQGD